MRYQKGSDCLVDLSVAIGNISPERPFSMLPMKHDQQFPISRLFVEGKKPGSVSWQYRRGYDKVVVVQEATVAMMQNTVTIRLRCHFIPWHKRPCLNCGNHNLCASAEET